MTATTISTQQIHPLAIPEIRAHAARYLTQHDRAVCSLVSHDWNKTFDPLLWNEFTIVPKSSAPEYLLQDLPIEVIHRHADHVEKLVCIGREKKAYLEHMDFPHLKDLSFQDAYDEYQPGFVHRHQGSLEHLFFTVGGGQGDYEKFNSDMWAAAATCPSLESLVVQKAHVNFKDWPTVWGLWSRLSSLHLNDFNFRVMVFHPLTRRYEVPVGFWDDVNKIKIKDLVLHGVGGLRQAFLQDELFMLFNCPELEKLAWTPSMVPIRGRHHFKVGKVLMEQTQHCPKLTHLTLGGDRESMEQDEILPFLKSRVNLPARLQELKIGGKFWFGDGSWDLVKTHFSTTIRVLEFPNAVDITGKMVQDMLCSLPLLEEFTAPFLRDLDILDDSRPWICHRIAKLSIAIQLTDDTAAVDSTALTAAQQEQDSSPLPITASTERMIFERLGALNSLTTLNLMVNPNHFGGDYQRRSAFQTLKFNLQYGLGWLKGLKQLDVLLLVNTRQMCTETDILWMLKQWPRMRYLYGDLHTDSAKSAALRKILDDRGIHSNGVAASGVSVTC